MPQKQIKLAPHKHCGVCGKAIPEDKQFCSVKCREVYEQREKRYRFWTRLLWVFMAAFIFAVFILPVLIAV